MNKMLPVTRVFDKTYGHGTHGLECCGHSFSGFHLSGDFTTWVEDFPVSRLTDIGVHYCPHCPINMNVQSVKTVLYSMLPSHCLTQTVTEFCGMGNSIKANKTVFDGE